MSAAARVSWAEGLVGRRVGGRYQLERVLGAGGMGAVLAARSLVDGARVAIKLVLPEIAQQPELIRRFHREARAAAAVGGRGVVAVLDAGHDAQLGPYFVMEDLAGETVMERLRRIGRFDVTDAIAIVRDIAAVLTLVHGAGVVHRDIKPANVFLVRGADGRDEVRLLDFGVARMENDAVRAALTAPGEMLGTPHFMAPEQLSGEADARSDVYSLGALAYTLLAGHPPYATRRGLEVVEAILSDAPYPSIESLRPDVPPRLAWIVERALAPSPYARFLGADDMVEALEGLGVEATRVDHDQLARAELGAMGLARRGRASAPSGIVSRDVVVMQAVVPELMLGEAAIAASLAPPPPAVRASAAGPSSPARDGSLFVPTPRWIECHFQSPRNPLRILLAVQMGLGWLAVAVITALAVGARFGPLLGALAALVPAGFALCLATVLLWPIFLPRRLALEFNGESARLRDARGRVLAEAARRDVVVRLGSCRHPRFRWDHRYCYRVATAELCIGSERLLIIDPSTASDLPAELARPTLQLARGDWRELVAGLGARRSFAPTEMNREQFV